MALLDGEKYPDLSETSIELAHDVEHVAEKHGTEIDTYDMRRMGKTQQLQASQRNFAYCSTFGFSMVLMSTWEVQLATATFGLTNGGTAGAIYIYIITFFGFGMAIVSMAEMASMYEFEDQKLWDTLTSPLHRAPTAGGQYHWVSEFATSGAQKFASYVTGWLCVLGWQAASAAGCYLTATQIEGLAILNNSGYVPQRWHGSLIALALVIFSLLVNTVAAKSLPTIEGAVVILHVAGFIAIVPTLWALSSHSSASAVFTQFNDGGDWHSLGLATLVGILGPTLSLIGPDAAVHIAEEVCNASKTLPRIMIATAILNGAFGFVMLVTICFCVGDLEAILATPTGYPFIQIFYNATQSRAGASFMTSIIIVLTQAGSITAMATASRQLFSFARDCGTPFHTFFKQVRWDLPLNAILTTGVISALLICISFGSAIAFNQLTALTTAALLASYMMSIGSMAWRRFSGRPLLSCQFSLGKWGLLVNVLALMFLILAFVMIFFPSIRDPNLESMNWSVIIFAGVVITSLSFYLLARKQYVGPVALVRKLE